MRNITLFFFINFLLMLPLYGYFVTVDNASDISIQAFIHSTDRLITKDVVTPVIKPGISYKQRIGKKILGFEPKICYSSVKIVSIANKKKIALKHERGGLASPLEVMQNQCKSTRIRFWGVQGKYGMRVIK